MSSEDRLKIRDFMNRYFRNPDLKDDDDIFALGYVNSLFSSQLILFIEEEFMIMITNKDLKLSNFSSIEAIDSLIERKKLEE